jgi:hypothetical protein
MSRLESGKLFSSRLFLGGENRCLVMDVLKQPPDHTDEQHEDEVQGQRRGGIDQVFIRRKGYQH